MRIDSRKRWAWAAVLVSGLIVGPGRQWAAAMDGPPPVLNPKTYASPSGQFTLFVDPSDLEGRGKASYRLSLNGRALWSAEKPYTLWDARVTDDGLVAGYAYSHGWSGYGENGVKGRGDFRVVLMDPSGKEWLNQVAERQDSHFLHMPPNPLAQGIVMDAANDRLAILVSDEDVNRMAESWWVYKLSTGKPLATFRPKLLMANPDPVRYLLAARPVAGTPLTLVHWYRYHWEGEQKAGARFTLIDQDGRAVWSLDLPDDYDARGDEDAQDRVWSSIHRTGGILGSDRAGRFEVRIARDARRVTFAVSLVAGGAWTVSEVERRPFVEAATPAPRPAEVPVVRLKPVGRIVLKAPTPGPRAEIRDVSGFVIDARGRIAFVRPGDAGAASLVVVDQEGKVLHQLALDPVPADEEAWSGLTDVGPNRYLLIRQAPGDRGTMIGAVADVSTGKTTPVPGFTTTTLSKVAGFPDGGFVIKGGLSYGRHSATGDDNLRAYNGQGKLLWSLGEDSDSKSPAALFGMEDVAVTTDGRIAVLSLIRKRVQFFDRSGKYQSTIDLAQAWGREPSYPSGLVADRDGGVVVEDFQGKAPIVRMKPDGTVRAEVKPRLEDGRTFRIAGIQVAPDGALWVSDGHALFRLAESGVVDRVLGEAPDPRRLDEAAAVAIDGKGRIYAVAGRTGAVHVFTPEGQWLRVCEPGAGDVSSELVLPHLTVSDAGDVYLGLGTLEGKRYLHFSPEGRRVGVEASKLDDVSETWYAQPRTSRRWVLGYEKAYLVDEAGAAVRTIGRRADGHWLASPDTAATAPDGSIAILSHGRGRSDDAAIAVSLYSPQGEPIRTFPLPETEAWSFPRMAYDGRRVVVAGAKGILLLDNAGKATAQMPYPAREGDSWWTPLLPPNGRELWLFDRERTIERFELP